MSDQWGAPPPQAPYEPQPSYDQGQVQPTQQQYTSYPPQQGQYDQQQQQFEQQQHHEQQQQYEQVQYEQPAPYEQQAQYEQQHAQYGQQPQFEVQQGYEQAPQYEIPQQLRYEMPQPPQAPPMAQPPQLPQPPPLQQAGVPQQPPPLQSMQPQLPQPPQQGEPQPQVQQQFPPQLPPQQPPRGNGAARAGAIACFVPLLGLVLSIVGLSKAKALGVGRGVAQLGIVLSLVFSVAWCAAGYYAYTTLGSSSDPGCVNAKADYQRYSVQMEQDAAAMTKGGVGSVAFTAAVKTYQADLAALIAEFDADSARAADGSVKVAIQAVGGDLTQLDTSLGDLATGNYAGASNVMQINDRLITDYQHLESVCGGASGG